MKKFFYAACLSLLLCLLNSCTDVYLPIESRQSHFSRIDRSSDICFTSLDRSVFGISLDPPSEADLRVIAGFKTVFQGGANPIPCNRLKLAKVSGRFSFDLSTINPERLVKASIVVDHFTPIGNNIIQEAIPWGLSGGWIGEPGRMQDDCRFKIKYVVDMPATSTEFLSPPPPTRELSLGGQSFSVANGHYGGIIDVTTEIRRQLESGKDRQFFLVEPNDIALDYQASNRFLGFFTFKLKVELARE